ncbi:hypothetical protein B0H14DRAFT_3448195 [Mycena olivaceomarginata]|nr:hypothetical protein B0H14DRAFT_3448195 [Mycena olivaceomarginata]
MRTIHENPDLFHNPRVIKDDHLASLLSGSTRRSLAIDEHALQMIPIGNITHRDRVRANRFVNGLEGTLIPDHIKIAAEGEPIRTLGVWMRHWTDGNWDTRRWRGRRLILMMVVGGMTQYLATVQGMPEEVEERLDRRIRSFLWADKSQANVNKEKNLLDLIARNEAITVTWLKTYLSFGPDRPLWCFVADEILANKVIGDDMNVDEAMRINTYLQSWAPEDAISVYCVPVYTNKWDPRGMHPEDYEEYQAPGAREEDTPLEEGEEAPVQFDPRVPGLYFGDGDPRNRSIRVPDEMWPSNQVGEVLAIKEAVEPAPLNIPLRIYSDSKYAIDGFTKNLQKWQDDGFYTVSNGTLFELTVAKIRERTAPTEFVWVKGHSGVAGNEAADALAGEGSLKPDEDVINASAQMSLILPGAKLKAMTQSKAYKIIRMLKWKNLRREIY